MKNSTLNNNIKLVLLEDKDMIDFKKDMQRAFQVGYEVECGKSDEVILPEKDILDSLNAKDSYAYKAVLEGETVGGAVVRINEETLYNHLDFLYVKVGCQSKGVGQTIWEKIEKLYPEAKAWRTCTPYFEKRNIHFYVNRCGFHIVEFYNPYFKNPDQVDENIGGMPDEEGDYFFEFEKRMK